MTKFNFVAADLAVRDLEKNFNLKPLGLAGISTTISELRDLIKKAQNAVKGLRQMQKMAMAGLVAKDLCDGRSGT